MLGKGFVDTRVLLLHLATIINVPPPSDLQQLKLNKLENKKDRTFAFWDEISGGLSTKTPKAAAGQVREGGVASARTS